jgi:hypothetical protein
MLKAEEEAYMSAFFWKKRQEIVAAESYFSFIDVVGRVPGEHFGKRRFASSIGAHKSVDLSCMDGKVHPMKDFRAIGTDSEV